MKTIIDKRPWGHFEQFTQNELVSVKLLYIKPNHRLSYQYHRRRSEFWYVVTGRILLTLNGRDIWLTKGQSVIIPRLAKHRALASVSSVILEIAKGHFDEEDIIRLADDYERC